MTPETLFRGLIVHCARTDRRNYIRAEPIITAVVHPRSLVKHRRRCVFGLRLYTATSRIQPRAIMCGRSIDGDISIISRSLSFGYPSVKPDYKIRFLLLGNRGCVVDRSILLIFFRGIRRYSSRQKSRYNCRNENKSCILLYCINMFGL